ncbi:general secretion pathway protein GspE [Anaeromyxobacter diazotrophicus]|uniref:Type II secretion system protein GspE N-terminal domain-containing protein n=1 Tax=Anaeromyxobacter diazotrophicus TaxID=2590199 RepID=A0A7I9VSY0_9BACT|nr:general secretion pathway protein GspE [Anaeromyxobacter diazotrophicus]GEJ59554.1 hypothetical protein AMYX_42950 [Anaeromyxobacter diazotrophicus]
MPLDLAALLVEAGAASAADVQRALERQRQAGGALDTALLELGLVEEGELVRFLARASGLPPAPLELAADPALRAVFPARVAERHGLAPFHLRGGELAVAVTHPLDLPALEELSFMLSLKVVPHVAPEWRVRRLLAQLFGGELAGRFAALASRKGARPAPAPAPGPAAGGEAGPGAESPDDEPAITFTFGLAEPEEPLAAALAHALESDLEALLGDATPPAPTSGTAPRWSRDEAFAALEAATGRDEVVAVALRYTLDFFEAAALLAVTRARVVGHDAVGWPDARERCRAVRLDRDEAGLLRAVLGTSGPYLGPVGRDPGNEKLLAGLGRAWPRTALVYPVSLRERTVCLLYADNGEAPVSPSRLGDLLLLLGAVGAALERVLVRGKQARAAAPAGEVSAGWAVREPGRAAGEAPGAPAPLPAAAPLPPPRDAAEAVARLGAAPRGSPARAELIARLAQQGPEAAAALRAAFPGPVEVAGRGAEIPVEERGPLLAALVALGPVATPYVIDLLREADPARRRLAALLLGRGADPAAFLPLADAALDVDRGARDAALGALAQQRTHPEFRPVLERLRRSLVAGEGDRRARAARALGALGDEEAIPLLVQALDAAEPVHGAAEAALEALTGASGAGAEGWLGWWRERRGRRREGGP